MLSATHRVIDAGQSPMLRDMFQALAQIEGADGPKYSRKALHILGQAISCRTYEKMALELAHMVRAAMLTAGRLGYEGVFWGMDRATPSAFRGHFAMATMPSGAMEREESGVRLLYPDGGFSIRFGRMPVLAAFLEFLVAGIGYAKTAEILRDAGGPDRRASDQSRTANALSRAVYEFLADHLPTVQNQRKFRSLIAFLQETLGPAFQPDAIGDDAILDFWRAASTATETGEGGDFRAYRTVFLAFLRLIELLEDGDALSRFEHMHAIGSDRDAGEIDPGDNADLSAVVTVSEDPLQAFSEPPLDAVKFLNKRETEALALPSAESDRVVRLVRSYLRAETFGVGQFRLIQALRRKAEPDEMRALAGDAATETYEARIAALTKIDGHLEKVSLAALYALRSETAEAPDDAPPIELEMLSRARQAFDGLSRQGFERARLGDPATREAFEAAAAPLAELRARLRAVLTGLDRPGGWNDLFSEDRDAFAAQFLRLYGDDE